MTDAVTPDQLVEMALAIHHSRKVEDLDAALARLIGSRQTTAAFQLGQLCRSIFSENHFEEFSRVIAGTHFRLLRAVEPDLGGTPDAIVARLQTAYDELYGGAAPPLRHYRHIDMIALASAADDRCRLLEDGLGDLICREPDQYDTTTGQWLDAPAADRRDRPLFAAIIEDAVIVGGQRTIRAGDTLIDETIDISPAAVNAGFFADRLVHQQVVAGEDRLFGVETLPPQGRIERAIFINSHGQYNYFHWLTEHLANVWLATRLDEFRDWPLVICSEALAHPNLVAALNLVAGDGVRQVHALKPGTSLAVDRLLVPSLPQRVKFDPVQSHPNPEDSLFSIAATRALHRLLAKPRPQGGDRRLFVRRHNFRRMDNEDAVAALLHRYRFEVLYPEDLNFEQKRDAFAAASVIIGAGGAALTNLVLAPDDCVAIVFANSFNRRSAVFSSLAACRGQRCVHCHAPAYEAGQSFSPYNIDPAALPPLLERLQIR